MLEYCESQLETIGPASLNIFFSSIMGKYADIQADLGEAASLQYLTRALRILSRKMTYNAEDGRIHQAIYNFIFKIALQPNVARYENAVLTDAYYS